MCILCNSKLGLDHNALFDGGGSSGGFNNSQFIAAGNAPDYVAGLLLGYSLSGNINTAASATFGTTNTTNQAFVSAMVYSTQEAAKVANINFTQVSGAATQSSTFFFQTADLLSQGALGVTYPTFTGTRVTQADVELDRTLGYNFGTGDGVLTMLHELGHALGLKHPDNYGGGGEIGPFFEPTYNGSVMSYVGGNVANDQNQPTTFMIYDIATLQYLYGANRAYNAGNTTYNFDNQLFTGALWDGGGTDTIITNTTGDVTLDLREGVEFFSRIGSSSIWNAFGTNIENATSGSGNDVLFGNDLNNVLTSRLGNDFVNGLRGNDTVFAGEGNDTIFGGRGNDSLTAGLGSDQVSGDNGNDILKGGKGNDTLVGGAGDDIISGDRGNDLLSGSDGVDVFQFRSENGNDTLLDFQLGVDKIMISPDIFSTGQAAAEAVEYGSFGGAFLVLGSQGSIEIVGIPFASLTASDFIISPS